MPLKQKIKQHLPAPGRLTSRPAEMIDKAYLNQQNGSINKFILFFQIRTIYMFLFLPMAVIDLVTSFTLATFNLLPSFFTSDDLQTKQLEKQRNYQNMFSKNFYALLFSFAGFFSPKLIAFYFIPEKTKQKGVTAGGHYYSAEDATLMHPDTVEEIQAIVSDAVATGYKVMPMGAGFSQGKQFLPEGARAVVINLSHLNTISIDADSKTATVGAGVIWSDLQLAADKQKLALKVMQASNVFSVGGSIGTNIHGWDHKTGMLSNTILEMEIINAQGQRQHLTPEDPLFNFITGGLGLFGIVIKVKLQLTDNELLQERAQVIEIKDYVRYFHETVQTNDKTRMHLFRLSLDPKHLLSTGIAVNYDVVSSMPIQTPGLTMEPDSGTRVNRIGVNLVRHSGLFRGIYWKSVKDLEKHQSAPLTTNAIMHPVINAMLNPSTSEAEWLQEYFIPGEELEVFLASLGQLLMDNGVILINASVRFVKQQDKSPLSYAQGGDRFAVVLCWNQSLQHEKVIQAKKWLREAQHMAVVHKGSYYLPYQHVSAQEDFLMSYPNAAKAQAYKKKIDPNEVFVSGFYQKYMSPSSHSVNHFKAIMASKETQKQFAGFLNTVLQRVDSKKFFKLLEDIMQYNDTHEEIYQELCRRLPEIKSSFIDGFSRILSSLTSIKQDLGKQARALLPQNLRHIDGLVEIGYPGRFVTEFKKHYHVTGKVVAAYEAPSVTDYIQTGFPRPYDQFLKLDYNQPDLKGLADKSADVVTCYVGLHHFPKDKLDGFLKDVHRVLREGGHFILVDHDITDDLSMSMAHMAHTIFNVTSGVSLEEEMKEYRDFHPMSYWVAKLEQHGLGHANDGPDVPMIRKGDSSRNRMRSFVKSVGPQLEMEPQASVKARVTDEAQKRTTVESLGQWRQTIPSKSTVSGGNTMFSESTLSSEQRTEEDLPQSTRLPGVHLRSE